MTYKPSKKEKDGKPAASLEERLLGLLHEAEYYAYVLAHSYDIGGQRDRAYGLVALGERLREMAMGTSVLTRSDEPHRSQPAQQGQGMVPLVPTLVTEQPNRESQERSRSSTTLDP
jgi:hypothetical protein